MLSRPMEKEEVSATFEIFLNRSTGKRSKWKQCLCCSSLVFILLTVLSFLAYFLSKHYKIERLIFADDDPFSRARIQIKDWQIEPANATRGKWIILIGGYTDLNGTIAPMTSLEILGGNISDCPSLPKHLFDAFSFGPHISGINDAGILGSCSHDSLYPTETKCKIYNPYKSGWDKAVPGSRGSKFAEDFVGFTVGKRLILQEAAAGGFVQFDLQSNPRNSEFITRLAQSDDISSGTNGTCYITLEDQVIFTGGITKDGIFERKVRSAIFQDEQIQVNENKTYPNLLVGRGYHGCGQFHQKGRLYLIVAGGLTGPNSAGSRSVEILSVQQTKRKRFEFWAWQSMGNMREPRIYFPTVAVLNNSLVIAGGVGPKDSKSVDTFDTKTNSWTISKELRLNEFRFNHATSFMKKEFCVRKRTRKEQFIWRSSFGAKDKSKSASTV